MIFSDSHCHLDSYQPELLKQIIQQARMNHVDIMVSMGMNLESSAKTICLAHSYPEVKAAVGIHPWNAVAPTNDVQEGLYRLAKSKDVVAIGEIGLDYARSPETIEIQQELLRYELSLAQETGLPVNIHCREAHQDMMDILRTEGGAELDGIIHGFSGDSAKLEDWLNLGFYVAIGIRAFAAEDTSSLEEMIQGIPLDRLLTETDSSVRGSVAGPVDVISVVEKLALVRQTSAEHIADVTTANIKRLLRL